MVADVNQTGYYSILRYRRDVARDEAKNLAVLLVTEDGSAGGFKSAPVSTISKVLRQQGLLDSLLDGLRRQFSGELKPTLADLEKMHEQLDRSIVVTEPRRTAVPDEARTLSALYRAYVAPMARGGGYLTKATVLNRVSEVFGLQGLRYEREKHIDDFRFDLVLEDQPSHPTVAEVLSFATPAHDWMPVEHDAGYFLYALQKLDLPGFAVVQAPSPKSLQSAFEAHERVHHLFDEAHLRVLRPSELPDALPAIIG